MSEPGANPMPQILSPPGATLRVLSPAPHLLAFYDGRMPGARLHSAAPNWLDDGAYGLGICSYAVFHGDEALVYDTHITLPHALRIRAELARRGATRLRVVLSHWHDDHVAGNAVFRDCEIIANRLTSELLAEHRAAMAAADPPISPLVMPSRLFEGSLALTVGTVPVELRQADIHSRDGTVALLPDGVLLAGDTLEDPITYVDEPDRLDAHLAGLAEMAGWGVARIFPNHGAPDIIAAGGYGPELIEATRLYVERLTAFAQAPSQEQERMARQDLRAFAPDAFATGAIGWFEPYEAVHRANLERVRGTVRA